MPPPAGGIATHLVTLTRGLRALGLMADVADPAKGRLALARRLAAAGVRGARAHIHVCGHNAPSYGLLGLAIALAAPSRPPIVTLHSGLAPAWIRGLGGAA